MVTTILRILVAAVVAAFTAAGANAQDDGVDVELVLTADGSGSIDDDELALQRQGYADAIRSREVLDVIRAGIHGRIAVAYVEWGGPVSQHVIVDWAIVDGKASAAAFAEALLTRPREAFGYNSISAAIDFSVNLIETNRYRGLKRVIDVSGDGPNIGGRDVSAARDDAVAKGITINGLVIVRPGGQIRRIAGEPLTVHYERDIIGGPGAFVMTADETMRFPEVVRRKMVLEIAGLLPGARAGKAPPASAVTR